MSKVRRVIPGAEVRTANPAAAPTGNLFWAVLKLF